MLQDALPFLSRQPLFGRHEALSAAPRKVGEGSRSRGGNKLESNGGGQEGAFSKDKSQCRTVFIIVPPGPAFKAFPSLLFMNSSYAELVGE